MESSSVSYSKIDIADLSYPSCAESIVLTVDDVALSGCQDTGRPVVMPRPSRIVKPIAGLPTRHEELSECFSGKTFLPNPLSSSIIKSMLQGDIILPTSQSSPVKLSGEYHSYFK